MVKHNRVSAVLVASDLERAAAFYEDKLGLTLSPETIKNHLVFECGGGTSLLIYGRPSGNKADHTQVRFWSTDIDKDVAELAGNGVEFDEYDTETFKTVEPRRHVEGHRALCVVQGSRRQHDRVVPTGVTRSGRSDAASGRHDPRPSTPRATGRVIRRPGSGRSRRCRRPRHARGWRFRRWRV